MVKGSIHINVPEHPYYGGDTIHGVVELDVHSTAKIREVKFFFAAYEFTHWEEPGYNNVSTFSQKRVFFSHKSEFFVESGGHQTSHGEFDTVEPGIYRWPFAVELPTLVPPSCKFANGRIEYKAFAHVDIQNANSIKHDILINVGGNLFDQIAYTLPTPPVHEHNSKKFTFSKGKLDVEVTLPKFHFFMGDIVELKLDVNNGTKNQVDAIKIALDTRAIFFAYNHTSKNMHHSQKRAYHLKIEPHEQKTLHLQYPLPADGTPTTGTSEPHANTVEFPQLVKVFHVLQVRLEVPFHSALEVEIPIALMRINPRFPRYQVPGPEPACQGTLQADTASPTPAQRTTPQPIPTPQTQGGLSANPPPASPPPLIDFPSTPPLPTVPFPLPEGIQPVQPPQRQSVYPIVSGYQYPKNTHPLSLSIGSELNEHEEKLMILF